MKLLFSIKNWRIRTRITALLLLPVVVAALLGGLRIQSSVDKTREMDVVQKPATSSTSPRRWSRHWRRSATKAPR
ncbi:hypothetical protein ACU686_39285 [Yinghuangia aomiensis]